MVKRHAQRAAGRAVMMAAAMGLAGMGLAGCRIDEHKNGDNKNVKISTPFGGLSVRTNEPGVQNGVGLEVYPGSTPEKKENGHEGSADVNMSFGSFHLGVKAVSYTTPDHPDQVLAFYRKGMAKFGTVIECDHHRPVGTPTRTPDGLTCEDSNSHTVHVNDDDEGNDADKKELKAGSKQHQHIVAVETKGSLTKYGLVLLDLPGKMGDDDGGDKQ